MSDSRVTNPAKQTLEIEQLEHEREEEFLNLLTLLVEKYGKSVLQDLQDVA